METYSLEDVKNFIRVDFPDDDRDIDLMFGAAVLYVKNATGRLIDKTKMNELEYLALQLLLGHWYENRSPVGEANKAVDFSLTSMFWQFKYCQ